MQGKLALASTIELILAREDVAFHSFVLLLPLVSGVKRETRVKNNIKSRPFTVVLRAGDLGGKPPITFPQKPHRNGTRFMVHDTLHKKYMVNSYYCSILVLMMRSSSFTDPTRRAFSLVLS